MSTENNPSGKLLTHACESLNHIYYMCTRTEHYGMVEVETIVLLNFKYLLACKPGVCRLLCVSQ